MNRDRDEDQNLLTAKMRAAFAVHELRGDFAERVTGAWLEERSRSARARRRPGLPLILGTLTMAAVAIVLVWLGLAPRSFEAPLTRHVPPARDTAQRPKPEPATRPPLPAAAPTPTVPPRQNAPLPATPDALYSAADKQAGAQQWAEARRLYGAFVDRHPTDRRAARAQYEIGEAYARESRFAEAVGAYTKVLENFPDSDAASDAMYKTGLAFYALKYCRDAKTYFQELLKRHPNTPWKNDVVARLQQLTRAEHDKALCRD